MSFKRTGFLFLIGTIAGSTVTPRAVGQDSTRDELTKALVTQTPIRLRLASGEFVKLESSEVEDGWVLGHPVNSKVAARYRIDAVEQVWHQKGAAAKGFQIGAFFGFLGGAGAAIAFSTYCFQFFNGQCAPPSAGEEMGAAIKAGLVGGAVLGGIGAVLGSMATSWKPVYQTRRATVAPLIAANGAGLTVRFGRR